MRPHRLRRNDVATHLPVAGRTRPPAVASRLGGVRRRFPRSLRHRGADGRRPRGATRRCHHGLPRRTVLFVASVSQIATSFEFSILSF